MLVWRRCKHSGGLGSAQRVHRCSAGWCRHSGVRGQHSAPTGVALKCRVVQAHRRRCGVSLPSPPQPRKNTHMSVSSQSCQSRMLPPMPHPMRQNTRVHTALAPPASRVRAAGVNTQPPPHLQLPRCGVAIVIKLAQPTSSNSPRTYSLPTAYLLAAGVCVCVGRVAGV